MGAGFLGLSTVPEPQGKGKQTSRRRGAPQPLKRTGTMMCTFLKLKCFYHSYEIT